MTDFEPDITLREIDVDALEDVEDNPESVQFAVRLSRTPSEAWIQEFNQIYKATPYLLKPPVEVAGDALQVIYLPRYANELRGFVHFLALIVRRANEEAHRTEELHASDTHERSKAEFRAALRQINLAEVGQL